MLSQRTMMLPNDRAVAWWLVSARQPKILFLPSTLTSGNLVSTTSAVVGWRAGSSPYKLGKHTSDPSRIWASTLGAWKGGGGGMETKSKQKGGQRKHHIFVPAFTVQACKLNNCKQHCAWRCFCVSYIEWWAVSDSSSCNDEVQDQHGGSR